MTKTANAYTPDRGELVFTVSAALVAASTLFTTAEPITLDDVVRKFEETQPKTREYSELYVTGSSDPIKTTSSKVTATQWTLTIVDDYSGGGTGEFGTDVLHAVAMFEALRDEPFTLEDLAITPAGGATGDIETTLVNVDVLSIAHPVTDADANTPNEVVIMLVVESYTKAAHT
ncbi:hypothetical protein KAR91_58765 [Candidatus Pacearchaeota archaeon]|nr:hypothetical protein [Candidatus Pacearchaeota archaeon]